jgi:cation diffusion facilitator CzcD-associated flavoprotein CzcO
MATSPNIATLPVVIIGAGPIGLAAAAHLVERGKDFLLLESGESVASSVAAWGHIRLFSGWSELIDPAARRLLESRGWAAPDAAVAPFAHELISDYLAPLAAVEQIASRTVTGTTVLAVSRLGMDRTRSTGRDERPFVARIAADGQISEVHARAVIDASGTFTRPNHLGSNGLDPLGLDDVKHLVSSALPDVLGADRLTFEGVHTVVVGAGHSAANTLLALAGLDDETRITWLLRNTSAARVTAAVDDGLPGRASLGARVDALVTAGRITVVDAFEVVRLEASGTGLDIFGYRQGKLERLTADRVVNATGFRPDLDMLREIRLDLDEVVEAPRLLAPLIDPNVHSCGTVEPHGYVELRHPESGFFIVGMKSYGRAPTFLLATGYEQVRSITAWLDNDTASARAVQLTLPATGVCSTDSGCCS